MARPKKNVSTAPIEKLKPFSILHYNFFPCCYSESLKQGYQYVLFLRYRSSFIPVPELYSPRFKSKQEAQDFVDRRDLLEHIIG